VDTTANTVDIAVFEFRQCVFVLDQLHKHVPIPGDKICAAVGVVHGNVDCQCYQGRRSPSSLLLHGYPNRCGCYFAACSAESNGSDELKR
jgi:hypothetical protein